jgi:hypothetical protein
MAKIDYSKAEKEISEALRKMRAKQLVEGKPITSKRAADYYGLVEEEPRPAPQDPVEQLLSEEAAKEEVEKEIVATPIEAEEESHVEEEAFLEEGLEIEDPFFGTSEETSEKDKLVPAKKQSKRLPKREPTKVPDVPPSEKFIEPLSPLSVLRKHLFWMKRLHITNRFEAIGTTKEEITSLCKARRLSSKQIERIQELNKRTQTVKEEILKKSKSKTDLDLIEKQKKSHKHKRFHKKETWLPL